jgi:U3 small nucleolar RNA-associated protein 14
VPSKTTGKRVVIAGDEESDKDEIDDEDEALEDDEEEEGDEEDEDEDEDEEASQREASETQPASLISKRLNGLAESDGSDDGIDADDAESDEAEILEQDGTEEEDEEDDEDPSDVDLPSDLSEDEEGPDTLDGLDAFVDQLAAGDKKRKATVDDESGVEGKKRRVLPVVSGPALAGASEHGLRSSTQPSLGASLLADMAAL